MSALGLGAIVVGLALAVSGSRAAEASKESAGAVFISRLMIAVAILAVVGQMLYPWIVVMVG